jgi:hypothetical protein
VQRAASLRVKKGASLMEEYVAQVTSQSTAHLITHAAVAGGDDARSARAFPIDALRRRAMFWRTQTRFRSDVVVKRAGRFGFDGYVDPGWKPPPQIDEMFVELTVGERYPRMSHACWWTPVDGLVVESVAEQQMSWEGGPAASRKGKRI